MAYSGLSSWIEAGLVKYWGRHCMKMLDLSFFSQPLRRFVNKYIFNYINKVIKKNLFLFVSVLSIISPRCVLIMLLKVLVFS